MQDNVDQDWCPSKYMDMVDKFQTPCPQQDGFPHDVKSHQVKLLTHLHHFQQF